MEDKEIKTSIKKLFQDEYVPNFVKLLETSEARIDKTNTMIQTLADTCRNNMNMYDKHLVSLEHSRDKAQENMSKAAESLVTMTGIIAKCQDEINNLRKELSELQSEHKKLMAAYVRLSENSHGSSSEVNISQR